MRARAISLLALAAGLAACASLTEKQCRSGDWAGIGRDDGAHGLPAKEFDKHREACKDFNVIADEKAYRDGREQGLKAYCTVSTAYQAARRGLGYHGVCADRDEARFLAAYRRGEEVAALMKEVHDLRQRVDELEVAAMSEESDANRTQLRFRADELNDKLRIRQWDLERADRTYSAQFGAPVLSWIDLREINP